MSRTRKRLPEQFKKRVRKRLPPAEFKNEISRPERSLGASYQELSSQASIDARVAVLKQVEVVQNKLLQCGVIDETLKTERDALRAARVKTKDHLELPATVWLRDSLVGIADRRGIRLGSL